MRASKAEVRSRVRKHRTNTYYLQSYIVFFSLDKPGRRSELPFRFPDP